MIQKDDRTKMQNNVQDIERMIIDESQHISILSSRDVLEHLAKDADVSLNTMTQLVDLAERQLRLGEEHRDIEAEQLLIQKQMLRNQEEMTQKKLSQEEERCLQLFRLQKSGRDESYEWYKNRVENRVNGTCQWFLDQPDFKRWLEQESGLLLVSADPGCGKSVLSKYLIDQQLPRSSTICYFFFKDQLQNRLSQAICAFLHQLFSIKPSLIRHAMPAFSKNGVKLEDLTLILSDILYEAVHDPETGPIVFVIDALDECDESGILNLAQMLQDHFLNKDAASKVKFLLTCRPYTQIIYEFRKIIAAFPPIHIPGEEESEKISVEINCVIKHRVNQLATDQGLKEDVKNHLERRLLTIPHRTYLWVYMVFDHLKQGLFKKTIKGVESPIDTLPKSVNEAYKKILSKSKDQKMVRKTLSIILAAKRPLTLEEMNVAVNIPPLLSSLDDLDPEETDDFRNTLRNWCGLFVSI